MTWTSDTQDEARRESEKRQAEFNSKLKSFNSKIKGHLPIVQSALDEISKQGLKVTFDLTPKLVYLYNRVNFINRTHCLALPWKFEYENDKLDDVTKLFKGYIFCLKGKILLKPLGNEELHFVILEDKIIFRSGYNYRSFIIYNPTTDHGSGYGLEDEIQVYILVNSSSRPNRYWRVPYSFGESVLPLTSSEEIVNTVHDWYDYASTNKFDIILDWRLEYAP